MRLAYWFDFEACGEIDDELSANDLKDMFSDITFEDCKPFPTCETCTFSDKNDIVVDSIWCDLHSRSYDLMGFCNRHPDFAK